MQTRQTDTPIPGLRDALGLQVSLLSLGFLAVVSGAIASAPIYVWVSTPHPRHPQPFPVVWFLGFVLPVASTALGAWALRRRRVRRRVAGYALVAGLAGLGIIGAMTLLALLLRLVESAAGA